MTQRIALLGSTGSIGRNAIEVISRFPRGTFEIAALAADTNVALLSKQANKFHPKIISVGRGSLVESVKRLIGAGIKVVSGTDGLTEIVSRNDVDIVIFATSGSSCIRPLLKAIDERKKVALANKESLVSAGSLIMKAAKRNNVRIIPIDSEHSAIFQCLEGKRSFLSGIYLTASGGPLLKMPKKRFDTLSRAFILKHPKWRMGRKISVDSATMMNKGLELIEASWLFDIDQSRIDILIHPEAIVHSMIKLIDGTVFAQLSVPDMRIPIQYALTYPERTKTGAGELGFSKHSALTFLSPDYRKFPCLELAREALRNGGTRPAVLNAADEEVVKNYLEGRINFSAIPKIIEKVLKSHKNIPGGRQPTIAEIIDAEGWAGEETRSLCYR